MNRDTLKMLCVALCVIGGLIVMHADRLRIQRALAVAAKWERTATNSLEGQLKALELAEEWKARYEECSEQNIKFVSTP